MNPLVKKQQIHYNPFKEFFGDDQTLDWTLFPVVNRLRREEALFPAIDLTEDEQTITVRADVPGLRQEDIQVSLENSILTIQGERKTESEKKDKQFHMMERSYGSFIRSFDLGTGVDSSKIKAAYKSGVLEIVLPKAEDAKRKRIDVKVE